MQPVVASVGPLATASATNIRTASSAASGAVTLNGSLVTGGVATLDKPRRILITTTADESPRTMSLTGTNWSGSRISETVTLPSSASTVASVLDYKTLTAVTISATSAGNISIGTNGVAGSPWVMMDSWAYGPISVQVAVSGTVNFDIEVTSQDPNSPTNPVAPADVVFIDCADTALVNKTANAIGQLTAIPVYARINLNSGSGSCSATFIQPGVVPQ